LARTELDVPSNSDVSRKHSLETESQHAAEISAVKQSYQAEIAKLKSHHERMMRNSNRSQEISEQMLKILRLQNENDELRTELAIQKDHSREMNMDYSKQIEDLLKENRLLMEKQEDRQSEYEKVSSPSRKQSWFDENSVDAVNTRIHDLASELEEVRDKNELLEQQVEQLNQEKHHSEERLKQRIYDLEQKIDPDTERLRERLERFVIQLEDKQQQIHTLKSRLNERDRTVQRMQQEFAPAHELESELSRLQEEQRSILLGEEQKHQITTERLTTQIDSKQREIDEYKEQIQLLKAKNAMDANTNGRDGDREFFKKNKVELVQTFAQEIERLRKDISLLSRSNRKTPIATTSTGSIFDFFWN